MFIRFLKLSTCLLFSCFIFGQEPPKWDLPQCVDYALKNNISVRQADLQIRFSKLDWQQSKMARDPSVQAQGDLVYSAGRNQDPTTFDLITTSYISNNFVLQASVDIFNWFSKKNMVVYRDLTVQASQEGLEKAKKDVALNVAVAYLQILLAREQINLAQITVEQTRSQLDLTVKQVEAGKLPELNAAQVESQLASDSANLIGARATAQQYLLQMKALLAMDAAIPFDIESPSVSQIPIESLADLQPDAVYAMAISNMPQQKVDNLNVQAAKKMVEVTKAQMNPTLSMFGSLGTTYNNKSQEIKSRSLVNAPIGSVTVGAVDYQVYPIVPFIDYHYGNIRYFDQFNQNFRQSVGLSLYIPIANGGTLRTGWQRAKLNVMQMELQKESNTFTLKQDIYKAYTDATAAVQKYYANKKSAETAEKAYSFATKRYDLSLLSTYELLLTQNALQSAKAQLLYAQFDYVFKMKLLEFYKGQGIKL